MVLAAKEEKAEKRLKNVMKRASTGKKSTKWFIEDITFKKMQYASEVADQVVVIEKSVKAKETASTKCQSWKHSTFVME